MDTMIAKVPRPAASTADVDLVLGLLEGFRRSKTLFAAVELGIFDGKRPRGAAVDRLLDACVSLGLLRKQRHLYVNTATADRFLRRDAPDTLAGYIRYSNASSYALWQHLEDAVIEGTDRWAQVYGRSAARRRHAALYGDDFARGMHGLGLLSSQAIARAYDLSCFSHVVDLGGSSGHLAAALARRYRSLRATVIDLPEVVARVRKRADPRVTFVAGDFLRDKLPAADLFALGRILHHRSDDESLALLRRLYDRLPAGGAVLIAERFAEPAGPVDAHMNSLHMLICSTRGGRERSAASYAAMLRAAGFTPAKPCRTPRVLDAMLGVKRTPAPPRGGRRGGAQ